MAADVGRELPTRAVLRRGGFAARVSASTRNKKGTASAVPVLQVIPRYSALSAGGMREMSERV